MREAYRLQKSSLTDVLKTNGRYLVVFFIYTGSNIAEFKDVHAKMHAAIKKLEKIADENPTTNT